MAITIDWLTKIISVPRADMTLIQSTPTEIRELDLNWFRLELKDIEDSEDGMSFLDTHRHNTEVTLGTLTFARVIELINGYTVTFEDGQYAVNLVGANSNVGDNANVNQVSIRSNNSAGLISSPTIEYSSFNDRVTIDTESEYSGTVFPVGTLQRPVNNLSDALLIAETRGFSDLFFLSNYSFGITDYVNGYRLLGNGKEDTEFVFENPNTIASASLHNSKVSGTLGGVTYIHNCHISNFGATEVPSPPCYTPLIVENCLISGEIEIPSNYSGTITAINCWAATDSTTSEEFTIDMNYGVTNLVFRNFTGTMTVKKNSSDNFIYINLVSGKIILDETVTGGEFVITGVGTIQDDSTGASVNVDGLINSETGGGGGGGASVSEIWNYDQRTLSGDKTSFDDLNDVSMTEIQTALDDLECSGGGGESGWIVDELITDHFPVVDINTNQLVSGIDSTSFDVSIFDPNNCNRVVGCGGDATALDYTISEISTTGVYKFTFTPDLEGVWVILIIHNTYFPAGKSVNYKVISASSGGGSSSESVTNEDLLAFILGLY
jgi:hypothetical protein